MFIFTNLDLFCIDNARVIYRKIRYLVGIRVRWNKGGTERTREYTSLDEETKPLNRDTVVQ